MSSQLEGKTGRVCETVNFWRVGVANFVSQAFSARKHFRQNLRLWLDSSNRLLDKNNLVFVDVAKHGERKAATANLINKLSIIYHRLQVTQWIDDIDITIVASHQRRTEEWHERQREINERFMFAANGAAAGILKDEFVDLKIIWARLSHPHRHEFAL